MNQPLSAARASVAAALRAADNEASATDEAVSNDAPQAARVAGQRGRRAAARIGSNMSDRVRETRERFLRGDMEIDDTEDRFAIPVDKIPDETTYEWKRGSVFGKDDPTYSATLQRGGWSPVEASRHPEMMPAGHTGVIERDGCVLMERPSIITDHIRARDNRAARELVRMKDAEAMRQTPDGTLSRTEPALQKVAVGIRRNYGPAPGDIPQE